MYKLYHYLWDQDGVLAHWGNGFSLHPLTEKFPNIPRHESQKSFNLKLGLTPEEQEAVDEIFNTMSYRDLEPMEGAVEAYHKTIEAGHKISILTSPWWTNRMCLQDKADWVEHYLGADARNSMHLGGDKTMVMGDYLIDDKPYIQGHYEPKWTQIVFDQPYNQEITHLPRLMSWADWGNGTEFIQGVRHQAYLEYIELEAEYARKQNR